MPRKTTSFAFSGGVNQLTPQEHMQSGELVASLNYEPDIGGGYTRCSGYERYDGRPKPSGASWWRIAYTSGGPTIPVPGDVVIGGSSGTTGVVIHVPDPASGSWAGGNAAGYLILCDVSGGTYSYPEALLISAVDVGTSASMAVQEDANVTQETASEYLALASESRRSSIGAVPGTGIAWPFILNGVVHAIRCDQYGWSNKLYRSSASGWQEITISQEVRFYNGTYCYRLDFNNGNDAVGPVVGNFVISEGGVSAQILAITIESGTFPGGDAAGYFLVGYVQGSPGNYAEDDKLDFAATRTYTAQKMLADSSLYEEEFFQKGDTVKINGSAVNTYVVGEVQIYYGRLSEGNAKGVLSLKSTAGAAGVIGDGWSFDKRIVTDIGDYTHTIQLALQLSVVGQPWMLPSLTPAWEAKYKFDVGNAYGDAERKACYGVNGVDRAFQYTADGVFTRVHTGMDKSAFGIPGGNGDDLDKPTDLALHKETLFLAFGHGVQHSEPGIPTGWSGALGAGEIATGDETVGMKSSPNINADGAVTRSLAIVGKNQIIFLNGSNQSDFTKFAASADSGAEENTVQLLSNKVRFKNDLGISDVSSVATVGAELVATHSNRIKKMLDEKKRKGAVPVTSIAIKSKNLYRIYYNDGTAISVLFGAGKTPSQFMPLVFPVVFHGAFSGTDENGKEMLVAGDSDGYVYQLDSGRSFDGAKIKYAIRTPFAKYNFANKKEVRSVELHAITQSHVSDLKIVADYNDGRDESSVLHDATIPLQGGLWDWSSWGQFSWGDAPDPVARCHDIRGIGVSISFTVYGETRYDLPHTLKSAAVTFSIRGQKRE